MAILAIDTAGPDCSVALARPTAAGIELLSGETLRVGRGHSDLLMPMIGKALRQAELDYPDLRRIAVTTGPGSFTGIRAGIAAARGLALALDIPAVGIGVLDALAEDARDAGHAGVVAAVLDARRGELFALAIEAASGGMLLQATAGLPDELAVGFAQAFRNRAIFLTGSGADLLAGALGAVGGDAQIVSRAESAKIATVARLGALADAAVPPAPFYLRGADAKPQTGKAVARR